MPEDQVPPAPEEDGGPEEEPTRELTPEQRAANASWERSRERRQRLGRPVPPKPYPVGDERLDVPAAPSDAYLDKTPSRTMGESPEGLGGMKFFDLHQDPQQPAEPPLVSEPPVTSPSEDGKAAYEDSQGGPGEEDPNWPGHGVMQGGEEGAAEFPGSAPGRVFHPKGEGEERRWWWRDPEEPQGESEERPDRVTTSPVEFPLQPNEQGVYEGTTPGGESAGGGGGEDTGEAIRELARIGERGATAIEDMLEKLDKMVELLEAIKSELPNVGGLY